MKKVVLLDLDETLIPDDEATNEALVAVAAAACSRAGLNAAELARAVREHARALWQAAPTMPYCHAIGISASEGLWADFGGDDPNLRALAASASTYRCAAWLGALGEFGVADRDLAASLADAFPAARAARIALFPEVDAVLKRLGATRQLGIITNGAPRLQRMKLADAGLAARGIYAIVSGEIGVGKPDPRIFTTALAALDAAPEDAVMVGDALGRDVAGARAAGLMSVWVNRFQLQLGDDDPRPDATIASLAELEALI